MISSYEFVNKAGVPEDASYYNVFGAQLIPVPVAGEWIDDSDVRMLSRVILMSENDLSGEINNKYKTYKHINRITKALMSGHPNEALRLRDKYIRYILNLETEGS